MSLAQDIRNAYDNRDRDALEHALRRMEAAIRTNLHPVQGRLPAADWPGKYVCLTCRRIDCDCNVAPLITA